MRKLSALAQKAEESFTPTGGLEEVIEKERADSWKYGGRTVFGKAKPPEEAVRAKQLQLF
jgi:hypothetical protein